MSTRMVKITRHREGATESLKDVVAVDAAVCIFIDDEYYRTLVATPGMTEELVTGHLFTERIIALPSDIAAVKTSRERVDVTLKSPVDLREAMMGKQRLLTTACLAPARIETVHPVEGNIGIEANQIRLIIRRLNEKSKVFKQTGGTHSALIHHMKLGEAAFAEDVGRHNAVDKAVGRCLLDGVDLSRCVLASSGRLSGEIVLKAATAGIPVICSLSAPLASGIGVAEEARIRLVGFVRGFRMNVYT